LQHQADRCGSRYEGTVDLARLVENVRWNQPFAVELAFLDPFVGCQDFFGNFYLEHCFAAGALIVIEGQIRHPNPGPFPVCHVMVCVVEESIGKYLTCRRFGRAVVDDHFRSHCQLCGPYQPLFLSARKYSPKSLPRQSDDARPAMSIAARALVTSPKTERIKSTEASRCKCQPTPQ